MTKAPRYKQEFLVKGKYLGACLRHPKQVHEEKREPPSTAFFCPVCAIVWAICPVTDTMTGLASDFIPYCIPCEQHDKRELEIPGSILLSWDVDYGGTLPDDVIVYEFQQAMKLYKE